MKIRTQHVSNSSSSSFVGWGFRMRDVIVRDLQKLNGHFPGVAQAMSKSDIDQSFDDIWDNYSYGNRRNDEFVEAMYEADELISFDYEDPAGFVVVPGMDETPRKVCQELVEKLANCGLEPTCEPYRLER